MVVVTTGTNKCATKRAAHGSHQYGRERSHHCGRGNHHSVMLSFAKILLRMIWDDHWVMLGCVIGMMIGRVMIGVIIGMR